MPWVLQLAFGFFFIAFVFIGLFWLLSRGGSTYYPDDIMTRFQDVWGQDHVLGRRKTSSSSRPRPDRGKGGYVPGGILFGGPPGTGKTLMAEAVAGETGKPYVFVDSGAFINMFLGVGILKVKSLFRKLRKLALRYGGVIVFFDEADALGNRGTLARSAPAAGRSARHHLFRRPAPRVPPLPLDTISAVCWPARRASSALSQPPTAITQAGHGRWAAGGGTGTLQALLTELSGRKKPRGLVNR